MYKKIVVPQDGSPLTEASLPHVKSHTSLKGDEVCLNMVAVKPVAEFSVVVTNLISGVIDTLEAKSLIYIQFICAKLQKAGIRTSILAREEPLAETILEVFTEVHADLIAISTHVRSGVSRWLMEGTAEQVVNYSPVPVLLIHPKPE